MVFPRTGLPNEVSVEDRVVVGTDDQDNPVFDTVTVLRRIARFYRASGRALAYARDTDVVEGMVAFPAEPSDTLAMIPVDSDLLIHGGQFPPEGTTHHVIHAELIMTWSRPSHWEILVGSTRG